MEMCAKDVQHATTSNMVAVAHFLVLFASFSLGNGLFMSELYPFGLKYGDTALPANIEDVSSPDFRLNTTIKFYGRQYSSIYVNENGLLSFLTEIPSFFNVEFPLDYPIISVFYADADCRESGKVWYRTTADANLLKRAQADINSGFVGAENFMPRELFIATWDQVGYYEEKSNKVNTYQVVIASSHSESYLMYLYPQAGIQWIKSQGKNRNTPDARGQVGIISGEGRHFLLPVSGFDQVQKLDMWSNANRAGLWMFKIGPIEKGKNVEEPTKITPNSKLDPYSAKSCTLGRMTCHSSANCRDMNDDFCCNCIRGWYGDGRTCLPQGIPQRVTGKVNGQLNSISITEQDLHCYVVVQDGRTYTAISKIDKNLGDDIQSLSVIGTPIAWLFALPSSAASTSPQNGFTVSGGRFNYTADVTFPKYGKSARITMVFKGLDAFDYLKVSVKVEGTLPKLGSRDKKLKTPIKVSLDDMEETFIKLRPGKIASKSERLLMVEPNNEPLVTIVTQTIDYTPGCQNALKMTRSSVLSTARNFIVYDKKEGVARFATTSKIRPIDEAQDPCHKMKCDKNSFCVLDAEHVAKCECKPGFAPFGPQGCADINECSSGQSNCSESAECLNTEGGFKCQCLPGFLGDGLTCFKEVSCVELSCDVNAECIQKSVGLAVCQCLQGFKGDGIKCDIIPSLVSLRGKSVQNEVAISSAITNEVPTSIIEHTYEVTNKGPLGNVEVIVLWTLKDSNGKNLTYLRERPTISIAGPDVFSKPCIVRVNQRKQPTLGRAKRNNQEDGPEYAGEVYIDEEYRENVGLIVDSSDYYEGEMTQEERELIDSYDGNLQYDYTYAPNQIPDRNLTAGESALLENVALESNEGVVSYVCSINLAPQEVATIKIGGFVDVRELKKNFKNVAVFKAHSKAVLVMQDGIQMDSSDSAMASTSLKMNPPPASTIPGRGSECGSVVCNKYADCQYDFGSLEFTCHCAPGFEGDGVETCDRAATHVQDCRLSAQSCHPDATCGFDEEEGSFMCICNPGFIGNGNVCRREQEPTCSGFCSENGKCVKKANDAFVCQCLPGFSGDGIHCFPQLRENEPSCIFGICVCSQGRIYDGRNCIDYSQHQTVSKPVALPNCYGSTCACPNGYEYSAESANYCSLQPIQIPASEVFCDLHNGAQCGAAAKCVYNAQNDYATCQCKDGFVCDGFECEWFSFEIEQTECTSHAMCASTEKCVVDYFSPNGRFMTVCMRNDAADHQEKTGVVDRPKEAIVYSPKVTTTKPRDLCSSDDMCHPNASCIFDPMELHYTCKCRQFFVGDGFSSCKPSPEAGCDITNDCHANAKCLYRADVSKHKCTCNDGYEGSGLFCEKVVVGCNQIDNCARYAKCSFNAFEGGYRCKCDETRGFDGDGFTCRSKVSCRVNPLVCDANADCLPFKGNYECQCRHGFLGDGHTCEAVPVYEGDYLVSSHGLALMKLTMVPTKPGTPIFVKSFMTAAGIDVDCFRGKIYWSDTTGGAIMRSNYDGSNPDVFLSSKDGLKFPEGVAIDWLSRNVYWADSGRRSIEVANIDTKGKKTLFDEQLKNPRGIAVDPSSSRLFWTDWDRDYPRIESSFLDGSYRKVFIDAMVGMPNALAVDFVRHQLCWTDAGAAKSIKKQQITPHIECIDLNGSNRRNIVLLDPSDKPYGLAVIEEKIYWTDWTKSQVQGVVISSGEKVPALSHIFGNMGKAYGIRALPSACPRASSPCQSTSGTCQTNELCLPDGHGGRSCVCFGGPNNSNECTVPN